MLYSQYRKPRESQGSLCVVKQDKRGEQDEREAGC